MNFKVSKCEQAKQDGFIIPMIKEHFPERILSGNLIDIYYREDLQYQFHAW